jgi:hypothetical protein
MSTDMVKEKAKEAFSNALVVGKKYAAELAESEDFFKPIVLAMAIQDLKAALTPEAMTAIRGLENSALGFKTDDPKTPYSVEVIKDCVVEAMLRGVSVAGNQFNIIKGNFYIARNGWEAKLRKAGCTEIVPTVGRPEEVLTGAPNQYGNCQITATFAAQASCVKEGKRYSVAACKANDVDGRIQVSAFGKDLSACVDGLKGKVEARILKKLYCLACDAVEPDEEFERPDVIVVQDAVPQIATEPAKPDTEEPSDARKVQKAGFDGWHKAAQTRVTNAAQLAVINEYWSEIANATNKDQLRLLHQDLTKNQVKPLGKNNVDELCRWCAWNAEVLP